MSTYYVRTNGNDSTGTGATGAPYLTVKKALTIATGGDYVLIGDGSYAEDSGSGYLNITNTPASNIVIAPESGVPGKVTITGTSAAYAVYLTNAAKLHFDAITFEGQEAATTATIRLVYTQSGTPANRFTRCTFRARSISGSTVQCIASSWTTGGATVANGFTFDGCTFEQIGSYAAAGILFDNSGAGSTFSGIKIQGCTFFMGGFPVRLLGCTDARVEGNTITAWSPLVSSHGFQIGVDGPTGVACSGVVAGNTIRTVNGHATVIGAGCNGVIVSGNRFFGGENSSNGQGLVIKEAQNVRVEKNIIHSGYLSGLYFKAAVDCQAFDNIVYNRHANSPALRVGINSEDSLPCQRLTIRRNYFHATAGTVLGFGMSSDDSGGSYVDENIYVATGSATLGSVRGNTVTKLSEVRNAWTSYDRAVNDRNSRIGQTQAIFAGIPIVDLPA